MTFDVAVAQRNNGENMKNPVESRDFKEEIVSTEGSSRGTGYIESNKILTARGLLHAAWLDAGRGGPEIVRIRTLDLHSGLWAGPVTLGEAVDNHGGPAIVRDREGRLHAVFGPHHGPFSYRRSLRPDDASEWTPIERFGSRCTYPSMVCDADNTLHLVCRESDAPGWRLNHYRRKAGGEWSEARPIVESTSKDGTYRCYRASLYPGREGCLHLGFMLFSGEHFRNAREEGLAGYMRSDDGGDTWRHFDGTEVAELPTDTEFERIPVKNNCIRTSNVAVDAAGTPHIMTVSTGMGGFENKWGEALLWNRTERGWEPVSLNPIIEQVYPGHRASWAEPSISFDTEGRLFAALVVVDAGSIDPGASWIGEPGSIYGNLSSRIMVLTSVDGGHTFEAWRAGKDVRGVPSWLPSMERFTGHNETDSLHMIYTHGVTHKDGKDQNFLKPQEVVTEVCMIPLQKF